ncbi:MAG: ABC transporter permease [Bifidobacteriaceae bacterium]|jgi:simple sugar transport system permease protein|nr:ABC transporter permease [Bifidobacteriaceae bacterium]
MMSSSSSTREGKLAGLTGATGRRVSQWLAGPVPTSVLIALVIGAGFMLVAGANPITGYHSMLVGSLGSGQGLSTTIQRSIPLVGMALCVAVAFRAGVLNLGAEGQMVLGGLAGAVVALNLPGPGLLVCAVACLAGIAAGALWGALSAALQAWPGVPLLITSLLLNYPARYFVSWMIRFPLKDPASSSVATESYRPEVQIPLLAPKGSAIGDWLAQNLGSDNPLTVIGKGVGWSLVVVIVLVALVSFINRRTVFGLESGINGLNEGFSRYSGVRVNWMTTRTMLLSGGIAGLVGVMLTIGAPTSRLIDGSLIDTNYAWTGLLVALLALYRPAGVVVAGVFFGAIVAGSGQMGRDLSMSPQIAAVVQGIVIVLIAFQVHPPRRRRRAGPPAEADNSAAAVPTNQAEGA